MRRVGAVVCLVATSIVGGTVGARPVAAATICTAIHEDTTLSGPVVVPAGALCIVRRSTVLGSVTVQGGIFGSQSSTVTGSVKVTDGVVQFNLARVRGGVDTLRPTNLMSGGNPLTSVAACGSTFGGPFTVRQGTNPAVNLSPASATCLGNRFAGNVTILNNTFFPTNDRVHDNHIGGNLVCLGNTPPPDLSNNTVVGAEVGQCAQP